MSTPQTCPTPATLELLDLMHLGALPAEFTAALPAELVEPAPVGALEFVDPEGLPLARVDAPTWLSPRPALTGQVTLLSRPSYGPFRRLYLPAAQVRDAEPSRRYAVTNRGLSTAEVEELRTWADGAPLTLLALAGTGSRGSLSPLEVLRASLQAAKQLPQCDVVAVPLPAHALSQLDDVLAAYTATAPRKFLEPLAGDAPAAGEQGAVIFFTGLSGSGKSTLARALLDLVLEQGERTVSSLDGDVVRRNLSAGLSFSKADRETNIRRIGWVAAEISRHHGLAIVSPIAPFAATRADVRAMVEAAGGTFFLVHVATPLEECERRDRKGLYAKARAGLIPEFTGISSPYEEPTDADVVVDTTGRSIEAALGDVLAGLRAAGVLDLGDLDPAQEVN